MNQQILSQDEVDALLQGITGESQKLETEDTKTEGVRDRICWFMLVTASTKLER